MLVLIANRLEYLNKQSLTLVRQKKDIGIPLQRFVLSGTNH
jgi:hypothetical protein